MANLKGCHTQQAGLVWTFLAAQSSSRSLVVRLSVGPSVGRSVGPSVGPSVGQSGYVCEKVTFRVSKGN